MGETFRQFGEVLQRLDHPYKRNHKGRMVRLPEAPRGITETPATLRTEN